MKRKQWMSAAWGKMIFSLCVVTLTATTAIAGSPKIASDKIASDLRGANAGDSVDVIIQYNQTPTARHHQKVLNRGGQLKHELGLIKAGAYSVPASSLADLANDPDVAHISPDRPVQGATTDTNTLLDYYPITLNAQYATTLGLDGTGIGVAVIDSGMIDIPDLHNSRGNEVVYAQDFVGGGTVDKYGHGSHVAGIIGGTGKNSSGSNYSYTFKGIASGVSLISLRVLDQNGSGTDRT